MMEIGACVCCENARGGTKTRAAKAAPTFTSRDLLLPFFCAQPTPLFLPHHPANFAAADYCCPLLPSRQHRRLRRSSLRSCPGGRRAPPRLRLLLALLRRRHHRISTGARAFAS